MRRRLSQVKERRLKLGINQNKLAQLANVSQSLVAKVESGLIDPSYTNAQKILEALHFLEKEKEPKVHDVMTKEIISIDVNARVADAVSLFKKHGISQMPVMSKTNISGLISESIIVNCINSKKKLSLCTIKQIMGSPPPQIPSDTPISIAIQLLKYNPLLIITGEHQIAGLITKSNLLDFIS